MISALHTILYIIYTQYFNAYAVIHTLCIHYIYINLYNTLPMLPYIICSPPSYYHFAHFIDEETEAWGS